MSVELNPSGVACNIGCVYCYENPMRDAKNVNVPWDWEKVRAALDKEGEFSLHGGEPFLAPMRRIEQALKYGFERHGKTGAQTNGTLITEEHIALFKRYNTNIGISCDGPERCSDARAAGTQEETRAATKKTTDIIERLLNEGISVSIITTLWKGNCDEESFQMLCDWFLRLDKLGLRWVNLHYLEVDSQAASKLRVDMPLLIDRMKQLMSLGRQFTHLKFDNFRQYRNLLRRSTEGTNCVWHACDVLTTPAVQGINGQGQKTNCNRTNKMGVDWTKADVAGIERQHALYNTPYKHGGCKGCRFFLMCKGECPGTGLDGDFRNRTEHCGVIMAIFEHYENVMLDLGETPASLHPDREKWERDYLATNKASPGSHGDSPHGDSHGDHTDARVQATVEVRK
jgi:uncharacterized protein